jgi:hypothetical protein
LKTPSSDVLSRELDSLASRILLPVDEHSNIPRWIRGLYPRREVKARCFNLDDGNWRVDATV